jgi:hypothetical protein
LAIIASGHGYSSVRRPYSLVQLTHELTCRTVEGAVTIVFGIICFFFMPDTPATARFLTEEEKDWALRRMRLDAHGATSVNVDEEGFEWYWVKMALKAPQTYFNSFIWFFLLVSPVPTPTH